MFVVNKSIRIEYQSVGGVAGLKVGVEIFDETGEKDKLDFPDFRLTEVVLVGSSMYRGEFTPDEVGTWTVHTADSAGGTSIKQYVVVKDDIDKIIPAMVG